jgi:hypothetical protein
MCEREREREREMEGMYSHSLVSHVGARYQGLHNVGVATMNPTIETTILARRIPTRMMFKSIPT